MSQKKKKEWWQKNKGFTVQGTFSQIEYEMLEVIEMIIGRTLSIADLRGTRIVKRIGNLYYKGDFQLWCLIGDDSPYNKIELILFDNIRHEKDKDIHYLDVAVRYKKRNWDYHKGGEPWETWTRYFKKADRDTDPFVECTYLPLMIKKLWDDFDQHVL